MSDSGPHGPLVSLKDPNQKHVIKFLFLGRGGARGSEFILQRNKETKSKKFF